MTALTREFKITILPCPVSDLISVAVMPDITYFIISDLDVT